MVMVPPMELSSYHTICNIVIHRPLVTGEGGGGGAVPQEGGGGGGAAGGQQSSVLCRPCDLMVAKCPLPRERRKVR